MTFKTVVAAAALALGLAAAADAADSTVSCRKLHAGGVSSICRWRFANKQSVEVYYGEPSPPRPSPEFEPEPHYAPQPVYYEPQTDYDYGYAWPWAYGAAPFVANRRGHDRHHGGVGRGFHGRAGGFHFGFHGHGGFGRR